MFQYYIVRRKLDFELLILKSYCPFRFNTIQLDVNGFLEGNKIKKDFEFQYYIVRRKHSSKLFISLKSICGFNTIQLDVNPP